MMLPKDPLNLIVRARLLVGMSGTIQSNDPRSGKSTAADPNAAPPANSMSTRRESCGDAHSRRSRCPSVKTRPLGTFVNCAPDAPLMAKYPSVVSSEDPDVTRRTAREVLEIPLGRI